MSEAILPAKPPRLSAVEMTEVVLPNDANPLGNMLGGRVLHFITPIRVGEACVLKAKTTWAGRTSVEVYVEVFAENLLSGERRHTTTAFTTFVAIDPTTGHPALVPPIEPETEEERRMFAGAIVRRNERLARRAAHSQAAALP